MGRLLPYENKLSRHVKAEIFAAADAALACSGTVAMELAWAKVPTVITYKMAWLTGLVGFMLIKIKYASMINLMADRAIQPEFLHWRCKLEDVLTAIEPLLLDETAAKAQIEALETVVKRLQHPDGLPSEVAAKIVQRYL